MIMVILTMVRILITILQEEEMVCKWSCFKP